MLETFELPGFLHELLPMGPKHPIRDKFTKNLFLTDSDIFISQLKTTKHLVKLYTKVYAKKVRQIPRDKAVEKTRTYHELLVVPFGKAIAFCILRKQTYEAKLESLLQCAQFSQNEATTDEMILKNEAEVNKEFLL